MRARALQGNNREFKHPEFNGLHYTEILSRKRVEHDKTTASRNEQSRLICRRREAHYPCHGLLVKEKRLD